MNDEIHPPQYFHTNDSRFENLEKLVKDLQSEVMVQKFQIINLKKRIVVLEDPENECGEW